MALPVSPDSKFVEPNTSANNAMGMWNGNDAILAQRAYDAINNLAALKRSIGWIAPDRNPSLFGDVEIDSYWFDFDFYFLNNIAPKATWNVSVPTGKVYCLAYKITPRYTDQTYTYTASNGSVIPVDMHLLDAYTQDATQNIWNFEPVYFDLKANANGKIPSSSPLITASDLKNPLGDNVNYTNVKLFSGYGLNSVISMVYKKNDPNRAPGDIVMEWLVPVAFVDMTDITIPVTDRMKLEIKQEATGFIFQVPVCESEAIIPGFDSKTSLPIDVGGIKTDVLSTSTTGETLTVGNVDSIKASAFYKTPEQLVLKKIEIPLSKFQAVSIPNASSPTMPYTYYSYKFDYPIYFKDNLVLEQNVVRNSDAFNPPTKTLVNSWGYSKKAVFGQQTTGPTSNAWNDMEMQAGTALFGGYYVLSDNTNPNNSARNSLFIKDESYETLIQMYGATSVSIEVFIYDSVGVGDLEVKNLKTTSTGSVQLSNATGVPLSGITKVSCVETQAIKNTEGSLAIVKPMYGDNVSAQETIPDTVLLGWAMPNGIVEDLTFNLGEWQGRFSTITVNIDRTTTETYTIDHLNRINRSDLVQIGTVDWDTGVLKLNFKSVGSINTLQTASVILRQNNKVNADFYRGSIEANKIICDPLANSVEICKKEPKLYYSEFEGLYVPNQWFLGKNPVVIPLDNNEGMYKITIKDVASNQEYTYMPSTLGGDDLLFAPPASMTTLYTGIAISAKTGMLYLIPKTGEALTGLSLPKITITYYSYSDSDQSSLANLKVNSIEGAVGSLVLQGFDYSINAAAGSPSLIQALVVADGFQYSCTGHVASFKSINNYFYMRRPMSAATLDEALRIPQFKAIGVVTNIRNDTIFVKNDPTTQTESNTSILSKIVQDPTTNLYYVYDIIKATANMNISLTQSNFLTMTWYN